MEGKGLTLAFKNKIKMNDAFQNLRQGNPFYILYRGKGYHCDMGYIETINKVPKFTMNLQNFHQPQEMMINVKVKVGEKDFEFQELPANQTAYDYPQLNGVTVFSSLDAINAEINSILQKSEQEVGRVDYYNSVIADCKTILQQLNPQFAKEKQQEEEIYKLKEELANTNKNIDNKFNALMDMVSKVLNDKSSNNVKQSNNK